MIYFKDKSLKTDLGNEETLVDIDQLCRVSGVPLEEVNRDPSRTLISRYYEAVKNYAPLHNTESRDDKENRDWIIEIGESAIEDSLFHDSHTDMFRSYMSSKQGVRNILSRFRKDIKTISSPDGAGSVRLDENHIKSILPDLWNNFSKYSINSKRGYEKGSPRGFVISSVDFYIRGKLQDITEKLQRKFSNSSEIFEKISLCDDMPAPTSNDFIGDCSKIVALNNLLYNHNNKVLTTRLNAPIATTAQLINEVIWHIQFLAREYYRIKFIGALYGNKSKNGAVFDVVNEHQLPKGYLPSETAVAKRNHRDKVLNYLLKQVVVEGKDIRSATVWIKELAAFDPSGDNNSIPLFNSVKDAKEVQRVMTVLCEGIFAVKNILIGAQRSKLSIFDINNYIFYDERMHSDFSSLPDYVNLYDEVVEAKRALIETLQVNLSPERREKIKSGAKDLVVSKTFTSNGQDSIFSTDPSNSVKSNNLKTVRDRLLGYLDTIQMTERELSASRAYAVLPTDFKNTLQKLKTICNHCIYWRDFDLLPDPVYGVPLWKFFKEDSGMNVPFTGDGLTAMPPLQCMDMDVSLNVTEVGNSNLTIFHTLVNGLLDSLLFGKQMLPVPADVGEVDVWSLNKLSLVSSVMFVFFRWILDVLTAILGYSSYPLCYAQLSAMRINYLIDDTLMVRDMGHPLLSEYTVSYPYSLEDALAYFDPATSELIKEKILDDGSVYKVYNTQKTFRVNFPVVPGSRFSMKECMYSFDVAYRAARENFSEVLEDIKLYWSLLEDKINYFKPGQREDVTRNETIRELVKQVTLLSHGSNKLSDFERYLLKCDVDSLGLLMRAGRYERRGSAYIHQSGWMLDPTKSGGDAIWKWKPQKPRKQQR